MSVAEQGKNMEISMRKVEVFGLSGIPIVKAGDNIGKHILRVSNVTNFKFTDGDVIVVAQKIISKAEGRVVPLATVTPTQEALSLAQTTGKDPRLCQLILDESSRILYTNGSAIITEHKIGYINTSSGVDRSNSESKEGEVAILLPIDSDKSAAQIREDIMSSTGKTVAVVISDSFGRPWRKGSVGMAIGLAGIAPLHVYQAEDLAGRVIKPEIASVDEITAAASLVMGESNEGIPVVVIRGAKYTTSDNAFIKDLLRPYEEDQIW